MVVDDAVSEADFAVDKVVDPFSAEDVDLFLLLGFGQASDLVVIAKQSRANDLVKVGFEAVLPLSQCARVVRADADKGVEDEVAFASVGGAIDQRGDGRSTPPGKIHLRMKSTPL